MLSSIPAPCSAPSDKTLLLLYRAVLLPWELELKSATGCWNIRQTRQRLSLLQIALHPVKAGEVQAAVIELDRIGEANYFVYTSSSSPTKDLFRHLRNAVAHAGVQEHALSARTSTVTFSTKAPNTLAATMNGKLRANRLPKFLETLVCRPNAS